MPSKKQPIIKPVRPERKHCPDCAVYLDGVKMAHDYEGTIRFNSHPGMQFHFKSTGTIWDRLGHNSPCHCATGKDVQWGYSHDFDGNEHHWKNKPCECEGGTFFGFHKN